MTWHHIHPMASNHMKSHHTNQILSKPTWIICKVVFNVIPDGGLLAGLVGIGDCLVGDGADWSVFPKLLPLLVPLTMPTWFCDLLRDEGGITADGPIPIWRTVGTELERGLSRYCANSAVMEPVRLGAEPTEIIKSVRKVYLQNGKNHVCMFRLWLFRTQNPKW